VSDLSIIPKKAVADDRLTGTDVRVLCAIGIHTDSGGEGAWANARTLAAESTISRSQFFLSTKKLLELGYIRRSSRHGRSSIYAIVLEHKTLGQHGRKSKKPTRPENPNGSPVQDSGTPPVQSEWTQSDPSSDPLTPNDGGTPPALEGAASSAELPQEQRLRPADGGSAVPRRAICVTPVHCAAVQSDLDAMIEADYARSSRCRACGGRGGIHADTCATRLEAVA